MTQDLIELTGTVDSVIFENEDNGYSISEIEDEMGNPVVLSGTMPYLHEGDILTVKGTWVIHPTYGRQLKVQSYEKSLPTGKNAILRYLASGAVKGIGPKTALKIVEEFGDETFTVLSEHPEWLSQINGISPKKSRQIAESYSRVAGARNVMIFFKDYLSDNQSMNLYRKYGGSAIDRIKNNPYLLCNEFSGIGFAKADQVALGIGFEKHSPFRIRAGIDAVIRAAESREGHTCLPVESVKSGCSELLGIPSEEVDREMIELLVLGELRVTTIGDTKYLSRARMHNAENFIAEKLTLLNRQCVGFNDGDVELLIEKIEYQSGIRYDKKQREAIACALNSGVMILTGGPGTGKTTVIKAMISIFGDLDMEIALAAPTGRAAKRMSEATSYDAKTIHRLLCMEFNSEDSHYFAKNEDDKLDEDVIIIDESSMVDTLLAEALLKAVAPGSRIIFIGDADQLPSVGAGNVLSDLINSKMFPTVKLDKIFRQSENSLIISNAHLINEGTFPVLSNKSDDFFFLPRQSDEATAATVTELCQSRLPGKYGETFASQIQIMTPSKKGVCGTEALNRLLQSALNPPSPKKSEKRIGNTVFRVGDRVMQTKNNYSLEWTKGDTEGCGIFNGDVGIIEDIDFSEGAMTVNFDERTCEYGFENLEELDLAYAITVHKSQGSEYPCVIIPLYSCAPMLLSRNLFYTAVTRASKMVILVGKKSIIAQMVNNDRHIVRYTGLEFQLKKREEK